MPHGLSIYGTNEYYTTKQTKVKTHLRTTKKRVQAYTYKHKGKTINVKSHLRTYKKQIKSYTRTKTKLTKRRDSRFTFYGSIEAIRKARDKVLNEGWIPIEQHADRIDAEKFLETPQEKAMEGIWTDEETDES
jgi:hypothetical protein